jgi:alpha-L-fucosidase
MLWRKNSVMKQIAHLMVRLIFGFLLAALTFDMPSKAAQGVAEIQPVRVADVESRINWWREARFGMFIHWGLYAIPGRGGCSETNRLLSKSMQSSLTSSNRQTSTPMPGLNWPSQPA